MAGIDTLYLVIKYAKSRPCFHFPYRRMLLEKLGIPFECAAPEVDETPQPGESPRHLVTRLAKESTVAGRTLPRSSDYRLRSGLCAGRRNHRQTVYGRNRLPAAFACARQYRDLYTGPALYNSASGHLQTECEPFDVHFRHLSEQEIMDYVRRERPLNCAGALKVKD